MYDCHKSASNWNGEQMDVYIRAMLCYCAHDMGRYKWSYRPSYLGLSRWWCWWLCCARTRDETNSIVERWCDVHEHRAHGPKLITIIILNKLSLTLFKTIIHFLCSLSNLFIEPAHMLCPETTPAEHNGPLRASHTVRVSSMQQLGNLFWHHHVKFIRSATRIKTYGYFLVRCYA